MSHIKYHFRPVHILLIAVGFYLLLTAAYTGYVVHREKVEWVAELDRDLAKAARTIPLILEPGFFERANRPGAISEEEDLRNIERLIRMADALGISYLYTLSDVDGTVYITSSSASAEERKNSTEVRAFTPYPEMADEARTATATGIPHFCTYTDRWGTFRHVYLPMKTPQGTPYILAADQSTEALAARLTPLIIQETSVPLFFVLAVIPFFVAYRIYLRKNTQYTRHLNQRLSKTQERFEMATQAGGIGIWDRDIVNDRLVWDERMVELYGVREEDFGGAYEAWQQCVHPDDLERAAAEVTAAEQGEKEFDTEFRIVHPDGEIRYIRAFAEVIRDENKNPIRMIGTNQDITERKRAEERIHALAEMVNAAPLSITTHDFDGNLFYANQTTFTMHQYSEQEFMAFNLHSIDVPESEALIQTRIEEISRNGQACFEVKHVRKDGSVFPLEIFVKQITWLGQPAMLSIGSDITERKQTEQRLQESEDKLRGIIENSTNLFYSHTPDHVLTFLSPQVKDILGYEVDEALKRWTEMAADTPEAERAMEITEEAIRTGRLQPTYELELIHKDGHPVWVEVREAPVVEDGETVAIVGSLNDITERKKAEEELRERMGELYRFNKYAVDRELRMTELKEEINKLCLELGREQPYPLQSIDEENSDRRV